MVILPEITPGAADEEQTLFPVEELTAQELYSMRLVHDSCGRLQSAVVQAQAVERGCTHTPKAGLWALGGAERKAWGAGELECCWRCFRQAGRLRILWNSLNTRRPCVSSGRLPLNCLQLVFALVWLEVAEQDVSLLGPPDRFYSPQDSVPFLPSVYAGLPRSKSVNTERASEPVWSTCSSTGQLCSFREGC